MDLVNDLNIKEDNQTFTLVKSMLSGTAKNLFDKTKRKVTAMDAEDLQYTVYGDMI